MTDHPATPADDELLTMTEVAHILRVPIATLRYWRYLGAGPRSFRVGRGVRYWRHDVHAWLRLQSETHGPSARMTRGDEP